MARANPSCGRAALRAELRSATANTLFILLAGALGAAIDEWHHWGLRTYLTLCTSGAIPWTRALALQLELLPGMLVAMTVAMAYVLALQSAASARAGGPSLRHSAAASHIGCLAAMLTSFTVCAALLRLLGSYALGVLTMAVVDALLALSTSALAVLLLRWVQATFNRAPAGNRPHPESPLPIRFAASIPLPAQFTRRERRNPLES
ncbi:MAG: hypothetical protein JSR15_07935 [Proteobacteria bacterium]|nr:hypothetical protein [Pseudomonadota bacterium]